MNNFYGLVVHCKKSRYEVYIGRPSLFGNPFVIGKDGSRFVVLEKYRKYLTERIDADKEFAEAVRLLRGKVLGCWCVPMACHGDILLEIANNVPQPV